VPIRYQADKDLRHHFILAVRRREPAIDFQTAVIAGLDAMDDLAVLRKAALEGRILVSHDTRTMPKALTALRNEGLESPGIFLVIPQDAEIQRVCESLILAWAASDPVEWQNRITKIPF
jgi:hypothetical protein